MSDTLSKNDVYALLVPLAERLVYLERLFVNHYDHRDINASVDHMHYRHLGFNDATHEAVRYLDDLFDQLDKVHCGTKDETE